jgi:hypothetical protein
MTRWYIALLTAYGLILMQAWRGVSEIYRAAGIDFRRKSRQARLLRALIEKHGK